MESDYDKELLDLFKDEINNGTIVTHKNSELFIKDIEKYYPFGFSSIDWQKKKYIYFANIKNIELEDKKKIIDDFFKIIIDNYPGISNEKIVVIGDNLTELCYEMTFDLFLKYYSHFFDIPQHTYIWFMFSKKCINMTFDDNLYFG